MLTTPNETAQNIRKRAEEKLFSSGGSAPELLSPEDKERQFHELRVHQIELEMQNEELRRAHEELYVSQSRYFDLYDLAPTGYITIDELGKVLEANLAAATMLGVERTCLLKKQLSQFIVPEDQGVYFHRRKLLHDNCELQNWEMRLKRVDGTHFFAELRATPAQNGEYARSETVLPTAMALML